MEQKKEPKCCCCGVRIGLGILYALILVFSIYGIIASAKSVYVPTMATGIVGSILTTIASAVGLWSIQKQESKFATKALWIFIGCQVVHLIIYIIEIVLVGAAVDYTLTQPPYDAQDQEVVNTARTVAKSLIIVGGIIGITITVVISGLIAHRTLAYKKWLVSLGK